MKSFSFRQQILLLCLALVLFFLLYFRFHPSPPPPAEEASEVVVEVSGEVLHPGIHLYAHPPALREVIERAGGLKDQTVSVLCPVLGPLETGTLLTVTKDYFQGVRVKLGRMEAKKLLVFSIPLDLNQASEADLCFVPGISKSLANEMMAYRRRRKAFRSVEEIRKIKGIGDKKYQALKPYLRVQP